ncbi:MAG: hypothetical protein NT018_03275 [Armatimonadetes bacterium]|nr:hypothetical protein [Armatimonadota bacterium]
MEKESVCGTLIGSMLLILREPQDGEVGAQDGEVEPQDGEVAPQDGEIEAQE